MQSLLLGKIYPINALADGVITAKVCSLRQPIQPLL